MSGNVEKLAISRDEQNLAVSIIQFLRQTASANQQSTDRVEAIEVAIQCLETAFALTDKHYAFQPSKPLLEIFKDSEGVSDQEGDFPQTSQADVEKAKKLKEEGNELVKKAKYQEAIDKYNEAIKLDRDPTYFCNRAAAYCRLDQNDLAIQDCRTALSLDPTYAKAYGRMGVAFSGQTRYEEAVEAYKKAIELDPNTESYKTNLAIAEEKLHGTQEGFNGENTTPGFPGFPGLGGLGGLGGMLNNPEMAQMAAQMMSNPVMQNMMGQMMGTFAGQGAGHQNANTGGLENLMRVGEQLAETLSAQNPELVEQLRQKFQSREQNGQGGNNEEPRDEQ